MNCLLSKNKFFWLFDGRFVVQHFVLAAFPKVLSYLDTTVKTTWLSFFGWREIGKLFWYLHQSIPDINGENLDYILNQTGLNSLTIYYGRLTKMIFTIQIGIYIIERNIYLLKVIVCSWIFSTCLKQLISHIIIFCQRIEN